MMLDSFEVENVPSIGESAGDDGNSVSGIARGIGLGICCPAYSKRGAANLQTRRFLKNFIRRPTETGAIAASSRELAGVITDVAQLDGAEVVVELGPGAGVFTEAIARRINPGTAFLSVEINHEFVEATRARCPGVTVVHDCAVNTPTHLRDLGHDGCDRIICGLPWASFSEALQDEILDTVTRVLRPGGRFVTFAYRQGLLLPSGRRFRKKLQHNFLRVTTTRTVWMNVPPAFVYCAEF
jgi:phosphatidylethanolamine/phosphatidyl-N-methylethanolamine N-methyltransferase